MADATLSSPNTDLMEQLLDVTPMTPTIGAVINNVDMSKPCGADLVTALREALLAYKVIFFRDQELTSQQQIDFAKNFGELEVHPFAPHKEGFPEVLAITHDKDHPGRENMWHSDVTWREVPSLGSILRGIELPDTGGDTLFSDSYAAYDGLSDDVKAKIEGKVAIHDFAHFRKMMKAKGMSAEKIEEMNKKYPMVEHPVVRTHPETGRKGIYVNAAFTQYIKGMEREESDTLLKHLYVQAQTPEYQCRFHWEKDSVAFWDNRACQHYAVSDYWPAVRRVERVTIIGDKPY